MNQERVTLNTFVITGITGADFTDLLYSETFSTGKITIKNHTNNTNQQ